MVRSLFASSTIIVYAYFACIYLLITQGIQMLTNGLMDSKAGHYISIVAHSANLSQPCTAENVASLCSPAQVHITTSTGSIPGAPEIWTPPYYRHTAVVPMFSALERIHCTALPFLRMRCGLNFIILTRQ